MKKTMFIVLFVLVLVTVSCTGENKIIHIGSYNDIEMIQIGDRTLKDKEVIKEVHDLLSRINTYKMESVNDVPNNINDYILFKIYYKDSVKYVYMYKTFFSYRVELPYEGVWYMPKDTYQKLDNILYQNEANKKIIKINGMLYYETDEEYVNDSKCAEIIASIHSNVKLSEIPRKDNESNFMSPLECQSAGKDAIAIWSDDRYIVFKTEGVPPTKMVQVNGKLFYETEEEYKVERIEKQGAITSKVDGDKMPMDNNQSNFVQEGYYQILDENSIVMQNQGKYIIFRTKDKLGEFVIKNDDLNRPLTLDMASLDRIEVGGREFINYQKISRIFHIIEKATPHRYDSAGEIPEDASDVIVINLHYVHSIKTLYLYKKTNQYYVELSSEGVWELSKDAYDELDTLLYENDHHQQVVRVNGKLYYKTVESSDLKMEQVDGSIDSKVDINTIPRQDNQSNFSDTLAYSIKDDYHIYVTYDNKNIVFEDIYNMPKRMVRLDDTLFFETKETIDQEIKKPYVVINSKVDSGNIPLADRQSNFSDSMRCNDNFHDKHSIGIEIDKQIVVFRDEKHPDSRVVRIDRKYFYETDEAVEINSEAPKGSINSSVPFYEFPIKDNQSNFSDNLTYRVINEYSVVVLIDGKYILFMTRK